jgi:hypothetical protein
MSSNETENVSETIELDGPVQIIENADSLMELTPPDPNATGPWVEYIGVATVRILNKADWSSLGIDSDLVCQWNFLNRKRLPKSLFNDAQLHYMLKVDGRFQLVDDDGTVIETTE